ncbi:MAG: ATP-binding protein [Deltaproteobacteria bacterium]|nr:ATP-binding protein [Deltaproteobacteria bacterium]
MSTTSFHGDEITLTGSYYFKQGVFENMLKEAFMLRGIKSLNECRQCHITIDWSSSYYYDLGVLLLSLIFFHQLKKQECQISIKLPSPAQSNGLRVWRFLKTWKFFEALNLCVDHPANVFSDAEISVLKDIPVYQSAHEIDRNGNIQQFFTGRLLEITNFLLKSDKESENISIKAQEVSTYINRWKNKVIALGIMNLCGWTSDDANSFVSQVIEEGLFNSLTHAAGTILLVAMNVDNKNLILTVADNGNGIPDTLRSALVHNPKLYALLEKSDSELIKYYTTPDMILNTTPEKVLDSGLIKFSTQKGVSSDQTKSGLGLYYLKEFVTSRMGELRIRSGSGLVDFSKPEEKTEDELFRMNGTMLRIIVPRKLE